MCKIHQMKQQILDINTNGRGTIEITDDIQKIFYKENINIGLCHFLCNKKAVRINNL